MLEAGKEDEVPSIAAADERATKLDIRANLQNIGRMMMV